MKRTVEAHPELLPLAARLARLHGCKAVISLTPQSWAETAVSYPDLALIEIRPSARLIKSGDRTWSHRNVPWDPIPGAMLPIDPAVLAQSVVLLEIPSGPTAMQVARIDAVRRWIGTAQVAVVASAEPRLSGTDTLGVILGATGLRPTFVGRTRGVAPQGAELAIVDRVVGEGTDRAPSSFSVIAVMTAYNEEDVIGPSIEALLNGGIGVHLIDNWSTDRTYEIAEGFLGRGLVGLERYPEAPTSIYDWTGLLKRVEVVSSRMRSDWCIHHDADERRMGPWPNQSLRDALWTAQRSGFNAVDHTVLSFRPVDGGFVPGTDYEEYFRYFEFGYDAGPAPSDQGMAKLRPASQSRRLRGSPGRL